MVAACHLSIWVLNAHLGARTGSKLSDTDQRVPCCRGEPVPEVEYGPEEVAVWTTVLRELRDMYPKHACEARACWCQC